MLKRLDVMDGVVSNSVVFEFNKIQERWQIIDIKGSEKQIGWATSIALNRIIETNKMLNKLEKMDIPKEKLEMVLNRLIELLQNNDANYWIETRNQELRKFLLGQ